MRCSAARRRLLERELAAPGRTPDAELARHLRVCADCAAKTRAGILITRELAALRTLVPFEVDVVERVGTRLAARRPAVPTFPGFGRDAVLWIAAGLAATYLALAWGLRNLPALASGARETWTLAAALGRVLILTVVAFGRTFETGGAVVARWLVSLASSDPLRPGSGLTLEHATLCAALFMTLLTVMAVLRDFRRMAPFSTKGIKE